MTPALELWMKNHHGSMRLRVALISVAIAACSRSELYPGTLDADAGAGGRAGSSGSSGRGGAAGLPGDAGRDGRAGRAGAGGSIASGAGGVGAGAGNAGGSAGRAVGGAGGVIVPHAGEAGAGGEAGQGEIVILPETLPDGLLDAAYRVQLTARGGASLEHKFALESGTLPPGLALDVDGRISGVPSEYGEFTFSVIALDTEGNVGRRTYTLLILRKHWLAYSLFESSVSTRQRLMLVDYRDPASEPLLLFEGTLEDARFSPDGRWLVYQVDGAGSGDRFNFVDTSQAARGEAFEVAIGADVSTFAWSPEGGQLLLQAPRQGGNELFYIDCSEAAPGEALSIASGTIAGWASEHRLLYTSDLNEFSIVDWNGALPGPPRDSGLRGYGWPWLSNLAIFNDASDLRRIVDLDSLSSRVLDSAAVWQAHPGQALMSQRVADVASFQRVVGTEFEPPLWTATGVEWIDWAHHQPWAMTLSGDRFVLVQLDGEPRESDMPGELGFIALAQFSPDDRWYSMPQPHAHWLSHVTEGGASEPIMLNDAPIQALTFGPHGRALLFAEPRAAPITLHLVDIGGAVPVSIRTLELDSSWIEPDWSSDEERIAYAYGSSSAGRALALLDVTDSSAVPRTLSSCQSAGSPARCPNQAWFQP